VRLITGQESTTDTQTDDRGQPGLVAQGPGRTAPEQAVAKNESTHTNDTSQTDNFVPTVEEVKQSAGLAPLHVRAAVAIPSDFLVEVWRARNPDKPAEQSPTTSDLDPLEKEYKDKVEGTVTTLLPREVGENPYPNVTVTVFQSLKPAAIDPPSMVSEGAIWAGRNSGSLIMAGLAVVSLAMLRSMVRSIPPAETNVIFSTPMAASGGANFGGAGQSRTQAGEPGATGNERRGGDPAGDVSGGASAPRAARATSGGRPRLKLKKGVTMKDDLTDIVREDPDAAAAIIRSWIGNAG
jgi:flagellar M-ring protein FliF